jgi:hypothetical protein
MTKEEGKKRLKEINIEAGNAKNDPALQILLLERKHIISEIGEICKGCGKKVLGLKYGLCFDCYENL